MSTETKQNVTLTLQASRRKKKIQDWTRKGLVLLLLGAISVFMLFPAAWMLSTSLKTNAQLFAEPPVWIPSPIAWGNYYKAWIAVPFTRYLINTLLYAAVVVFGTVLSNALVAYGFARLKFPGRDFLFGVMLATMMVPGMVTMIPQYVLYAKLGWVGTYLPLTVPAFAGGGFFTFLLRQFFLGLPEELSEAARIDGAGELYIWARIILPLSKAALATVAIFQFDGTWTDYIGPVIYLSNEKLYTLQVGLAMFRSTTDISWQYIMAASTVVALPVVVLFFSFQRYFIEGGALSGIKG